MDNDRVLRGYRMMRALETIRAGMADILALAVSLALSVSICTGLLYFGKSLWWVYVQTPVGQQFLRMFSKDASELFQLYDHNLYRLALAVHWFVVRAALLVGIMSQAAFLTSEFYDNTEGLRRFGLCLAPFIAFGTWHVHTTMYLGWFTSSVLVAVASLLVLDPAMRVASKLLPDGILLRIPLCFWHECRRLLTAMRRFPTSSRCPFTECHQR
jgi:hypothetical protein